MRIAVTGSIATDHLMTFPGRFTEQLVADKLDRVSLSFLVDDLVIHRGGAAANICFGMASLGEHPVLVGAVGGDFEDYRSWLERHGVDCASVEVHPEAHTARFLCTTDRDYNQLASFYPGAMALARHIDLAPVADRLGGLDLVVVSPNDPQAMARHTRECRERGIPFAADPSQQLAYLDGPGIADLLDGARYLLCNDYEAGLIQHKTGWSKDEVLEHVDTWVVTKGPSGCTISQAGAPDLDVRSVPEVHRADPTGVGDGFRAGLLVGIAWGVGLERAAQVGSMLATYVLETVGTQEYRLTPAEFRGRFARAFGDGAAADLASRLPG